MKLKFKLQIFLIAALMCCLSASMAFAVSGVSVAASKAQGGDIANGVRWDYDGKGTLTFSYTGNGSGAIPDGESMSNKWRVLRNELEWLIIRDGVTRIGETAFMFFKRNKGWKRVSIGDTVKTISDSAFYSCYDICSLRLGKNIEKIGKEAFVNPSALTTLTLPPALREIGEEAFKQAFSLAVITFTVPKPENYHDLDIGKNAFSYLTQDNSSSKVKIAYTSEKGILIDRNTKKEIVEGSELTQDELSNRQLTWIKHTPKNYVITYDANGGRLEGGITTQRVPVNSTDKLYTKSYLRLTNPQSTLLFKGWSKDKNATKAEYKDGADYKATDDVTLYAVWGLPAYVITFDANGGTFSTNNNPTQEIERGETEPLRLAGDLGLSNANDNLYFVGWATSTERAKAVKVDYNDGAKCKPTANMTLYAVWEQKIVVKFDPNEAKGGRFASGDKTISLSLKQGERIQLPESQKLGLYNISEDLYFMGWSKTINGSSEYDDAYHFSPAENITLYAAWGGKGDGTAGSPYIIDSLKRLKELSTNTNEKTAENSHFKGKYFKLTVNIDATSEDWKPIGKAYSNSFNGHFDGGGHSITYKISNSRENQQGLFGYISEGASIKKLRVKADISGGGTTVGGIVGTVGISSTVTNCYSIVNLSTTLKDNGFDDVYIGGIAGSNIGTIGHCAVNGSLKDNGVERFRIGGIVGVNQGGKILSCTAITTLGTTKIYAGMITGYNMDDNTSTGTIAECNYSSVWAKEHKGVGYDDGTRDIAATKALSYLELKAYVKELSDEYAVCKAGITDSIATGYSDDDKSGDDSSSAVVTASSIDITQSANAEKIKSLIPAISNISRINVYPLSDDDNVMIGGARTSADISDADKKTIGSVEYMQVLPEILIIEKPGVYVFKVSLSNIPAGTSIVFHSLPQSSVESPSVGEVQAAASSQNYTFTDDNINKISAVPSSQTVNVAAYFEDGTYAPVIAGTASDAGGDDEDTDDTSSKGSSSSGCNAGFGVGLAALLLIPFVKKIKG